jgi:single-strand DNA-binding protein
MNVVVLIGNLTRDPEVRYTSGNEPMAVATLNVAVNRMKKGEADFPRVIVFGKQAENCEKYLEKGRKIAVRGRIQTGSYKNKNGETVYTTDVVADRVEFLGGSQAPVNNNQARNQVQQVAPDPADFEALDENVPF